VEKCKQGQRAKRVDLSYSGVKKNFLQVENEGITQETPSESEREVGGRAVKSDSLKKHERIKQKQ
jgi:hypothetical protein